jgi:putative addiction module component (TIGR02574 family)
VKGEIMAQMTGQFDFTKLSIPERIILVQDIWDSIAAEQQPLDLTDGERQELEQRLQEHLDNPDDVVPWEEIKAEIQRRKQ